MQTKILHAVCQEIKIYFTREICEGFERVSPDDWRNVVICTENNISYLIPSADVPESIDDFLSKYSRVFSEFYLNSLREKFSAFDTLFGAPVCAALLQSQSFEAWAAELVEALVDSAYKRLQETNAFEKTKPIYFSLRKKRMMAIPQFDGPAKDDANEIENVISAQTYETETTLHQTRYSLHQIDLKGHTILDAWNSNTDVAQFSLLQTFPPGWTPQSAGSFDVFHGTSAHLNFDIFRDEISCAPFKALGLMSSKNQMVTTSIPCIYTAFSALRCFLWAAFTADVIDNVPRPYHQATQRLQQTWMTGGQAHRGVVLFHFGSSQPTVGGLSSYIIPSGSESGWCHAARFNRGSQKDANMLWRSTEFHRIHQQESTKWPDIIHGLEIEPSKTILSPFIKNFWRTVWCSRAARDGLNGRHIRTYAISFELTPKVQSRQEGAKAVDTERGSWGRKTWGKKTWGKNTIKKLKDVFH
jgi:hypothetical protein